MATLTKKSSAKRKQIADAAKALARHIAQFAPGDLWMSYDKEADVAYINFGRPQKTNRTVEQDDGVVLHYRDKELASITVLFPSTDD